MKFFLLNPGGLVVPAKLLPAINSARAKTWLMRISLAYTVLLATTIHLLANTGGNGQSIEKEMVTIELQNDNLEAMVKKIEAQSSLRFIYLPEQLVKYEPVSISKAKRSIKETLDLALTGTALQYEQSGRYIVLNEKKKEEAGVSRESGMFQVSAQIAGKITDGKGQALAGVNIVIKGSVNGTTSDANGDFSVEAEVSDVLVFSFIGFRSKEIVVGNQTVINLTLEEDATTLGPVEVNVGYWTVDERRTTGSVARVTSDEISRQPVSNPLATLEGRMPGVYVQQTTGMPGGGINIQIRGRNSVRNNYGDNGNLPLYIIDGVPFTSTSLTSSYTSFTNLQGGNPLSAINPSDIESIDVLKDADATAIYGSRGSNGVVLITTKKGKEGKPKFDFSISRGAGEVSRKIKMMNTPQYLSMRREAFKNDGLWPLDPAWYEYIPDLFVWDTTRYTDWQKEIIGGTANYTNAQASLSGGSQDIQFFLGGGLFRETTVFPGDYNSTKGSVNLNVNFNSPNKKLQTSVSVNYVNDNNDLPDQDLTTLIFLPPNTPKIYNDDGSLNWDPTWPIGYNPLSRLKINYKSLTNNLISNAKIKYLISEGLAIKTNFGFNSIQVNSITINPIASKSPLQSNRTGRSTFYDSDQKSWIIEPQLEYSKIIASGILTFLSGATFQSSSRSGQNISAEGYTNDVLIENILSAPKVNILNTIFVDYRYAAVFGRINYDWRGKYIINLTGRRDGSSRFGANNKFSNFGAIGIAWIFTDEPFFQNNLNFLSYGKLRSSYGVTGNDQINDYGYLDSYSSGTYGYNGVSGLVPTKIANPDYSWEKNKKFEVALELGLFEDKIRINTSYYLNRSSNQLVGYPLAPTTGFNSVLSNRPATVQNTGIEFDLTTLNLNKDGLVWTTGINVTIPKNKLVAYPNLAGSSYASMYEVGQPLSIARVYSYTGVDSETGLYTFLDVDNNGVYNNLDKKSVFSGQKMYGGIQNRISFKGFELDFIFQFVDQTGYNYLQYFSTMPGSYAQNQPVLTLNRWQKSGDRTDIQKFQQSVSGPINTYSLAKQSDLAIGSASFIRLKNISISYMFPNSWLNPIHIRNLSIYLQGQNLFTITDYSGADPETLNAATLAPLRVITGGLKFNL